MSFENINNSDIRCGLIQSIKLSMNYIETIYSDYNEYCSFEWKKHHQDIKTDGYIKHIYADNFMNELNNRMINVIEKSFLNNLNNSENLYDEIEMLVYEYEKNGFLKIIKDE